MKKSLLLSFLFSVVIIAFFIANSENTRPAETIQKNYFEDYDTYLSSVEELNELANNFSASEAYVAKIRSQFIEMRNNYKRIEWLAEYIDPEFIKDYINGAPLLSLERKADDMRILEPEGMQVLDELIFSEDIYDNETELQMLTGNLLNNSNKMKNFNNVTKLTDRMVIEAARFQLIRILSLGVTGFDTPLSGNAMNEAKTTFKSLSDNLSYYYDRANKKEIVEDLQNVLKSGNEFLTKNNDFDNFDRLYFLKNHINPAFALILKLQKDIGIETVYEVQNTEYSNNYLAENIFQNDFLNKFYYMQQSSDKYSEELVELGRLLFFDPILSRNNERACASCHHADKAFSDGMAKSIAFNFEGTLERNSPTLVNSVFADRFFHDMRVTVLENQMDHVFINENEFHTSFNEAVEKIQMSSEYKERFNTLFPEMPNRNINKYSISTALSAYVSSLSGFNSEFDKYVRGEINNIDDDVKNGFNLFMGKAACGTCHFAPTFAGLVPPKYHENETEVLGVPATTDTINAEVDPDIGRMGGIVREEVWFYEHSFKTPTIRNIELTAPYMHNGVYKTLDEVMVFYNNGGGAGLGINLEQQTLPTDSLHLTQKEISDIIAFMNSLTDTTGMTKVPTKLPAIDSKPELTNRKIGGEY